MTETSSDRLELRLLEIVAGITVYGDGSALARALLAYRDYVHKDKDTEQIDADLAAALGVK